MGLVGSSVSWNSYPNVWNNPVNMTDPSGRLPIFLIPILAVSAGAALNGGAHAASQLLNGMPVRCLDLGAIGPAAGDGVRSDSYNKFRHPVGLLNMCCE